MKPLEKSARLPITKKRRPDITDPIESIIAEALTVAGIDFQHDSEKGCTTLDFYLPESGLCIECKQFHSDRIAAQMAQAPDIIAIQGRDAAEWFAHLLRGLHQLRVQRDNQIALKRRHEKYKNEWRDIAISLGAAPTLPTQGETP